VQYEWGSKPFQAGLLSVIAGSDALIWQMTASVAMPGFTINRIVTLTALLVSMYGPADGAAAQAASILPTGANASPHIIRVSSRIHPLGVGGFGKMLLNSGIYGAGATPSAALSLSHAPTLIHSGGAGGDPVHRSTAGRSGGGASGQDAAAAVVHRHRPGQKRSAPTPRSLYRFREFHKASGFKRMPCGG
jgi:hypothetical protein